MVCSFTLIWLDYRVLPESLVLKLLKLITEMYHHVVTWRMSAFQGTVMSHAVLIKLGILILQGEAVLERMLVAQLSFSHRPAG